MIGELTNDRLRAEAQELQDRFYNLVELNEAEWLDLIDRFVKAGRENGAAALRTRLAEYRQMLAER